MKTKFTVNMQKVIFAVLISIMTISSTNVSAQTKPAKVKTEQEITAMLCKKWKLTHMESEGQRFSLPPEMGESFVTFKADGSLTESDEGNISKGKWTYEHKTMTLKTYDKEGKESHKIISITPEQLILRSDFEGMTVNMVMKKV